MYLWTVTRIIWGMSADNSIIISVDSPLNRMSYLWTVDIIYPGPPPIVELPYMGHVCGQVYHYLCGQFPQSYLALPSCVQFSNASLNEKRRPNVWLSSVTAVKCPQKGLKYPPHSSWQSWQIVYYTLLCCPRLKGYCPAVTPLSIVPEWKNFSKASNIGTDLRRQRSSVNVGIRTCALGLIVAFIPSLTWCNI